MHVPVHACFRSYLLFFYFLAQMEEATHSVAKRATGDGRGCCGRRRQGAQLRRVWRDLLFLWRRGCCCRARPEQGRHARGAGLAAAVKVAGISRCGSELLVRRRGSEFPWARGGAGGGVPASCGGVERESLAAVAGKPGGGGARRVAHSEGHGKGAGAEAIAILA